ncbi:H-2 class II histocompatibility antigen, A-U alpha chain-like isoform X1 [Phycodurus eques]|uniref:H-2 class II histocompatibility antigen, A-U alpha chain-like isoform X1 n=1 Tax=Phycodurus eques TaxID=693459 RepID=UPI002ACEE37D|nr:H-2 class II histocompatibility antigen, A-U alpha chain-like isoform X1 [Phycodurus eques]
MKALLFLVLFLGGSDGANFHTDIRVVGCSDTEGEQFYALAGEDMWFADFAAKRGVEPQPPFVAHMTFPKETFDYAEINQRTCRRNLNITRKALRDQPLQYDRPSHPVVYPRDEELLGKKNTLVCHVSGFFPAPVKVRWTENGARAAGPGRVSSSPYPDEDGSFHQTFQLDYIPAQGDIYTCVVEHAALERPRGASWVVQVKQPSIGTTVFCVLGLTVGLAGVATGTFFFIKGNKCS